MTPFVQAAYLVPQAADAAEHWAREFGAGPFFLSEHISLKAVVYRGSPGSLDHTSAYGQLGPLMVELVQQHGDQPSVFSELYGPGQYGLHHMAYFASNLDAELARLDPQGFATAMTASTGNDVRFAFADATRELGHMLEIYQDCSELRTFYSMVAAAARDWDGREPVRRLGTRS